MTLIFRVQRGFELRTNEIHQPDMSPIIDLREGKRASLHVVRFRDVCAALK
jgi:hypothetical protein